MKLRISIPRVSIARWLPAVAVVAVVLGVAITSTTAAQQMEITKVMTLKVIADTTQLDVIGSPTFEGQGTFYIPGQIVDTSGMQIGNFHCWGFFINGGAGAIVIQEYELFGEGKIQVQGIEDEGPRAVIGGTGKFLNVRGEIRNADFSGFPPEFTVKIRLRGVRGK